MSVKLSATILKEIEGTFFQNILEAKKQKNFRKPPKTRVDTIEISLQTNLYKVLQKGVVVPNFKAIGNKL